MSLFSPFAAIFRPFIRASRRRVIHGEVARLRKMTVGDIMTTYIISVKPDEDVIKAATKMIAEDISCLVVVVDDVPVGMISERDFLRRVPLSKEVFKMKVADMMTKNPVTVSRETTLVDAVALMKEKHIRRLTVVDGKKIVGIVTQTDFTKTIAKVCLVYAATPALSTGQIMTKTVLTVTPEHTVVDAKKMMVKLDVGAILIVDKNVPQEKMVPLGIFTEYDVVMQFYDQRETLETHSISEFMRKYVRAAQPDMSLFEANRLMLEKNMRRLLIVDGTKIVGIVTQTDICRRFYSSIDIFDAAADDSSVPLKRFSWRSKSVRDSRGEHLQVYSIS